MNHWMTRLLVGKVDMSIISTEDSPWCTPWLTGHWKPIIFLSIRRGPPVHVHHWHWCRRYITVLMLTASKTAKVVKLGQLIPFLQGQASAHSGAAVSGGRFTLRGFASQFIPVQFKMVSMRSEKPVCTPPCLSEDSPTLPLKQFRCPSASIV